MISNQVKNSHNDLKPGKVAMMVSQQVKNIRIIKMTNDLKPGKVTIKYNVIIMVSSQVKIVTIMTLS